MSRPKWSAYKKKMLHIIKALTGFKTLSNRSIKNISFQESSRSNTYSYTYMLPIITKISMISTSQVPPGATMKIYFWFTPSVTMYVGIYVIILTLHSLSWNILNNLKCLLFTTAGLSTPNINQFSGQNLVVTTPTQPQLKSKVGVDTKMTLYHHPPTTQTQCHQYCQAQLRLQLNFSLKLT